MPIITIKSDDEIKILDDANRIVHEVLNEIEKNIKPNIPTIDIENIAISKLQTYNARPAFKGYKGFPCATCVSVNKEVVHGIPGPRIIKDGDIVSVDFGVIYNGYVGDAARTFIVGAVDEKTRKLVEDTRKALFAGIEKMVDGNELYDINSAINKIAVENHYGVVRNFCGHGVGIGMHEDPHVYNYVQLKEPNVRLRTGVVLALEPMFCAGTGDVDILSDEWTVATKDKKPSCHWELSVAITKDGPKILGK